MGVSHPAGSTVVHEPDPRPVPPTPPTRTAPYNGYPDASGGMRIRYIVEGEPVNRDYLWIVSTERYEGSTAGLWKREYVEASPPTVPPSGTYTVHDGAILRETGTWRR